MTLEWRKTPINQKSHSVISCRLTYSLNDARVNTSSLMNSLHVYLCTCKVHGISADSMAEYIFFFLMLLVLKNHQYTSNHGWIKNAHRKPIVRILHANCNKDHRTVSWWSFVLLSKVATPMSNGGYTRYCHYENFDLRGTCTWLLSGVTFYAKDIMSCMSVWPVYIIAKWSKNKMACKLICWHCTYKFYSPEIRWCVICVGQYTTRSSAKQTKWYVNPAKTQISLCIRSIR